MVYQIVIGSFGCAHNQSPIGFDFEAEGFTIGSNDLGDFWCHDGVIIHEMRLVSGGWVGISAARGDGLSNKIAAQARARAYGGG